MEHTGPALQYLSQDSRFTLTNMAIEAGAKSGIVAARRGDARVRARRRQEATGRVRDFDVVQSDPDATYAAVHTVDVERARAAGLVPVAAVEGAARLDGGARSPSTRSSSGRARTRRSRTCASAAHILRGRKADPRVRLMVIPATQEIWLQANREGLLAGVRGGRRDRVDADMRGVPGRPHGRARARRGLRVDVEPQLRRAHGPPGGQGLPGEPGRRRRDGGHGPAGPPRRGRRRAAGHGRHRSTSSGVGVAAAAGAS